MDTYLAIMVTVLAACEIVRIVQNHINLRRQRIVFEQSVGSLSDITEQDLQTQREAYRLIVKHLTPMEYSWQDLTVEKGSGTGK